MLSLVTAAEHQYRHDTRTRDREIAVRASIRERRAGTPEPQSRPAERAARPPRGAWARPIHGTSSVTACAAA